jgi:cold shock CspA family protein
MIIGRISKLVGTHGSAWGRIRPDGQTREVFFNPNTLADPAAYAALQLGQEVEFEEEQDRANGTHAIHVRVRSGG